MNRRGFLRNTLAAAAAAIAAPALARMAIAPEPAILGIDLASAPDVTIIAERFAGTGFAALSPAEIRLWSRSMLEASRDRIFMREFGDDPLSPHTPMLDHFMPVGWKDGINLTLE